jgi:hypothetical protein
MAAVENGDGELAKHKLKGEAKIRWSEGGIRGRVRAKNRSTSLYTQRNEGNH